MEFTPSNPYIDNLKFSDLVFCQFSQKEFRLGNTLVFDINASNQILLVAQRPKEIGGPFLLTKVRFLFQNLDVLLDSFSS